MSESEGLLGYKITFFVLLALICSSIFFQKIVLVIVFLLIALYFGFKAGYFYWILKSYESKLGIRTEPLGKIDTEEIKEVVELIQDADLTKIQDKDSIDSKIIKLLTAKHHFVERNILAGQDLANIVLSRKIVIEITEVKSEISFDILKTRIIRIFPRFDKVIIVMLKQKGNEKILEYSKSLAEIEKGKIIVLIKDVNMKKEEKYDESFRDGQIFGTAP